MRKIIIAALIICGIMACALLSACSVVDKVKSWGEDLTDIILNEDKEETPSDTEDETPSDTEDETPSDTEDETPSGGDITYPTDIGLNRPEIIF